VQALIREVAYNTLSKHDRRARHLAAARYFESQGTDELAGALAGHYLAAHATAPEGPEADALAVQARLALEGAAARASALGSHDQAVAFLEQALGVTTNPADRATILERAGDSARSGARLVRAEGLFGDAITLHRARGDRAAAARATASLASVLLTARRLDDGLAVLEPAAAEFTDLFPDPGVVALDGQLARALFLAGDLHGCLDVAERVLGAAERSQDLRVLADTLVTKGSALGGVGRGIEGDGVIQIGERIAAEQGFVGTQLRAINNRVATLQLVDPKTAHQIAGDGLELARRIGDRGGMFNFAVSLGADKFLFDADADAALADHEALLAEEPEPGERMPILIGLAWMHAVRGHDPREWIEAMSVTGKELSDPRVAGGSSVRAFVALIDGRYEEALELFRATPSADDVGGMEASAARIALWMGDTGIAAEELARIDDSWANAGMVRLRKLAILAGIAAVEGDIETALSLYGEVGRGWRELGIAWEESFHGLDMAILLDPAIPAVRAAADRSRELFTKMGAVPLLEMLDAATSRPAGTRTGTIRRVTAPAAAEPA
jgi:tetratricopeptide (TPR) repeat protein